MTISFEFFPPRQTTGFQALQKTTAQLARWQPEFVSMTYGAGGSSQNQSKMACQQLLDQGFTTAAHITCVGASQHSIAETAQQFVAKGINHFVALRGDLPEQNTATISPQYKYANELVAGIRDWFSGTVSVAAYPEVHPEAASSDQDISALQAKLDAGADQMISQYCYDTNKLLKFADTIRQRGIEQPLRVGIMPIHNLQAVQKFSARCGASLPKQVANRILTFAQEQDQQKVAVDIAIDQCHKLRQAGLDKFHFYTLNRSVLTQRVLQGL